MKPIRLSAHALGYAAKRGFTVEEVEETIRGESWEQTERGRLQCRRGLPYRDTWNGKWYETKLVRPIFVDEPDEIVVVTVYTYYFSRRHQDENHV